MGMVIRRSAYIDKDVSKENVPPHEKGKVKRLDRRKNKLNAKFLPSGEVPLN